MKDQVAVIGVGCTKFGDLYEHGYEDLICEAAFAGVRRREDRSGRRSRPRTSARTCPGRRAARRRCRSATRCASTTARSRASRTTAPPAPTRSATPAWRSRPGVHDVVLVLGAEKLKDRGGRGLPRFGHPLLANGNSAPGLFALAANRYMHTFGVGRETLAKVAVKNHYNGARNPKAHLRMEITERAGAEGADDRVAVRPLRLLPDDRRRRRGDRLPRRPGDAVAPTSRCW